MNLNYLFYHKYFDFLKDGRNALDPVEMNRKMTSATVKETPATQEFEQTFFMKTTYPGLLVGIGNAHDIAVNLLDTDGKKLAKDAIKMGFTLDYVTGMPVIHGSTVKGILRSAFSQHPDYVKDKLEEVTGDFKWSDMTDEDLKVIENKIFGDTEDTNIYEQDIFFDAVCVKTGANNRILGEDFVTPHKGRKKELDGLVEPNPIRMLKVIPNVVFAFRFICKTTEVTGYRLDWDIKEKLFQGILEDLGVGAKTNTGYGNLLPVSKDAMQNNDVVLVIDRVDL